jgi:hypothetical protein
VTCVVVKPFVLKMPAVYETFVIQRVRAVKSNEERNFKIQGGSNMTGTNCDLFTHKSSRSYLNHLVYTAVQVSKSAILTQPFYCSFITYCKIHAK